MRVGGWGAGSRAWSWWLWLPCPWHLALERVTGGMCYIFRPARRIKQSERAEHSWGGVGGIPARWEALQPGPCVLSLRRAAGQPLAHPCHGRPGAVHGHRDELQLPGVFGRLVHQHHGLVSPVPRGVPCPAGRGIDVTPQWRLGRLADTSAQPALSASPLLRKERKQQQHGIQGFLVAITSKEKQAHLEGLNLNNTAEK